MGKLNDLLKAKGWGSASRLAERLNTPLPNVSRWARDERSIPANRVKEIAEFFGVSAAEFIKDSEMSGEIKITIDDLPIKFVPLIETTSCGSPDEVIDLRGEKLSIPISKELWKPELYALKACGESMADAINDGDRIICDPTISFDRIKSGDIVHFRDGNESAVKALVINMRTRQFLFRPRNESSVFKTRAIDMDSEAASRIVAYKVIFIVKDMNGGALERLSWFSGE